MNTDSVECVRLTGPYFPGRSERALKPGEFIWGEEKDGERYLYIVLPGGVNPNPDALSVRRGAPGGDRVWG